MKGYIVIVKCASEGTYEASFPDLRIDNGIERSIEEALHWAQCALNAFARSHHSTLPPPRPSDEMLAEAARRGAVGAMCILPRPATED